MKSFHYFRCPRCGHVEETLLPAKEVAHPCERNRNQSVVCKGFDPSTEAEEAKP